MKFATGDFVECMEEYLMEPECGGSCAFTKNKIYKIEYIEDLYGTECYVLIDDVGDKHWMNEEHAEIFVAVL